MTKNSNNKKETVMSYGKSIFNYIQSHYQYFKLVLTK